MKYSTDLLLLTPSNRTQVYQSLGSDLAAIEPPVWSGLIASFIRNKGHTVKMLDAEALSLTAEQTAERIKEINPRLLVYMVYGQQPSAFRPIIPERGMPFLPW